MKHFKTALQALATTLLLSGCCADVKASILGSTVTGGMFFSGDAGNNQFDPSNAGSGTMAVAGAFSPTFSTIVNGEDFNLSADFTASQLNIAVAPYRIAAVANSFELVFSDDQFSGLSLSLLSTGGPSWPSNGLAYALSGNTITINVGSLDSTGPQNPYTASFSLMAAVPEASSALLLLLGLGSVTVFARYFLTETLKQNR